jgi:hypothetical protein
LFLPALREPLYKSRTPLLTPATLSPHLSVIPPAKKYRHLVLQHTSRPVLPLVWRVLGVPRLALSGELLVKRIDGTLSDPRFVAEFELDQLVKRDQKRVIIVHDVSRERDLDVNVTIRLIDKPIPAAFLSICFEAHFAWSDGLNDDFGH